MTDQTQFVDGGSVTSPKGFKAGAAYAGIKTYAKDKWDVGILLSEAACVTAGMYTTNKFVSPSVTLTKERVDAGYVRGLFVSSGIANTGVGEQGLIDAIESIAVAAQHVGISAEEMAIGTTGVIGVELPMALIRAGIPNIVLTDDGGEAFARSIMTTDRVPKTIALEVEIGGKVVTIGGCAKGSGMIHPNMATMLAYVTTDAAIEHDFLNSVLHDVVDDTFNMVTIDGDRQWVGREQADRGRHAGGRRVLPGPLLSDGVPLPGDGARRRGFIQDILGSCGRCEDPR